MRKEDVLDVTDIEVLLFKSIDQQWNTAAYAGIDERSTTTFNDQMAGILQRALVFGVDGNDAIIELYCLRGQSLLRFGGFQLVSASPVQPW